MIDQTKAISQPWWSYLRLSPRAQIILVLAIVAGLGWTVLNARFQHDAVAAIERAGGRVAYDWEYSGGVPDRNDKPWAPQWLVHRFGRDYFGHVAWVYVQGESPDRVMPKVGQLNRTKILIASHTPLTNAGLAHVKPLLRLELLFVDHTQVSDAGLVHLTGLSSLQQLELSNTGVTDVGLVHLQGLTGLRDLLLGSDRVTDAGLAHLKNLTNLQVLRLDNTQITGAGLAHLHGLTRLHTLNLRNTQVDDAGLTHLAGLTRLRTLLLDGTQVTKAGEQALKQSLPNLRIMP
jgi:hypothetical protein